MADKVRFELVSPERMLFSADVEMAVLPGTEGDFAVLPGHEPTIALIRVGVVEFYDDSKVTTRIFVAGGFADVTGRSVTLLAEDACDLATTAKADLQARVEVAEAEIAKAADEEHRVLLEQKASMIKEIVAGA